MYKDKILRRNFSYLFVLQIANYIIPLFLIPYLGRVLGSENFGKLMFAQAVVAYFVLFTDFGFNVSSTKEIADARGNGQQISETFWNTLLAKTILLGIGLMVFIPLIFVFEPFKEESLSFFISFGNVLASVLLPLWFFQGVEKMKLILVVNVLPRIVMCFVTVQLVNDTNDYNLALCIQVVANIVSALLSLIIVFRLKLITPIIPSLSKALEKIKESWHIFATSLSSNLYTTTNSVVLGLLAGNNAVGIYSAGDKIVRALIALLSSITQVVFPRVNVYLTESRKKSITFIKQILMLIAVVCIVVGIILYFFANDIIGLMFEGGDFQQSVKVLQYSALLPLFSVVNGVIAINVFITLGYKKNLLRIVFTGCVFSLICISPLVLTFREVGAVICATLTEMLIFALLISFIIRKKIISYV